MALQTSAHHLQKTNHFDPTAFSVLDPVTGELLEHGQLCRDPRYKATWDTSYANELGACAKALDWVLRQIVSR